MDVISMMDKINVVANPVIGESALPDLLIASDQASEFVGVRAFDQLDCAFDGYVDGGSQQQMHVFGHDNEGVQSVSSFAAIAVDSFQEEADIDFDGEQLSAMESREGCEIGSRRGEESSRLQERTSAARSRMSFSTLNWHEWNSCPSRWFFAQGFSFWEKGGDARTRVGRGRGSNREGHEFIRADDDGPGFKALAAVVGMSKLQRSGQEGETSAAESRASFSTLNWHEWNSCPSRLFFAQCFSF